MRARATLVPVATLGIGLLGLAGEAAGQAADWREIKKQPLRAFQPQQPRRIALGNGMVIFLQEDHELPLIRGTARIRGGGREEPAEKAGLSAVFGQAWRTGGTKSRTGDELDDYLEARAARVESGAGLDSTTLSWDCLKGDFPDVLTAFTEVLRQPEFREDKITLAKNQLNTQTARRNDEPTVIAGREVRKLGYGADSPYARVPEYATVAAVSREDLVRWHQAYVQPNNVVLGVVGDFDGKSMEAALRKAFASWPRGPAARKVEVAFKDPRPGVYVVEKEDVNQSNIRMVHLGTTRDNPDYWALEVMNEVFGGGFSARLFSNIRSKKGLAYSVGGGVGSNFDHPGLFQLSMGTKSETTAAAIDALYEEIDGLHRTPATPEELQRAKDAILNSFVFRLDTKQKVLSEQMSYEFYGYPADFLARYPAQIQKVTAEDVARVARKYVQKDKIALLVVGKPKDFERPLSAFGALTAVDITIPEPGAGKKGAVLAAGSNPEGRALLAKVLEGLGGASKLKEVRSFRQKASVRMKTPQGEVPVQAESLTVFPDRLWQQMQTPMGTMTTVVSPEASFAAMPMGTREMPASQKESSLKELRSSPLFVAAHADDPRLVVRAAGSEKVAEAEAKVLEVRYEGAEAKWLVDPASGRVVRTVSQVTGMGGPAEQVVDYSDFRPAGDLTLAYRRTITRNGQDAGSVEIQQIEINPPLDPKAFEKPPAEPPKP